MKNKVFIIIIIMLLLIAIVTVSLGQTERIKINTDTFSFVNKEDKLSANFDSNYELTSNSNNDQNVTIQENITELTKKTTYLLLGEPNKNGESSEDYYKRHKDYLNLRYNPQVPADSSTNSGLDENSQEYKDDLLSGLSVPGMFLKINELGINYNSYGEIRVSVIDESKVISTITLSGVTIKEEDKEDPMKYNTVKTDLKMYYYFKKLDNEYKLLYLYGESNDDVQEYIEKSNEQSGQLSKDSDYDSMLRDIYNFSKADAITDDILLSIYNANRSKIVFLDSTYNTGIVTSANGFFINEGLILTTYNYIENSLMKAQNIIISDSLGNTYDLDGVVTINLENDIAVLKVKNKNPEYIKPVEINKLEKEDAVITLNSKTGVGLTTAKGIVISTDSNMQTSLPVSEQIQGSPLFNAQGQLIGMINSKIMNSSISYATNFDILNEYYNKFANTNSDDVKSIPFEELKENYYINYKDENIVNNISEKKWKKYIEAENLQNTIGLELVKAFYTDNVISLRYRNDIPNYIDTMSFASEYRENLKSEGYNEKIISDSKIIYENKNNQIVIMTEFDYLIIVMVRV